MTVIGDKGIDPALFLTEKRPTDSQKLAMLKDIGEKSEVYPQKKGRRYLPSRELQFPWLKYSYTEDSANCKYCVAFGDKRG